MIDNVNLKFDEFHEHEIIIRVKDDYWVTVPAKMILAILTKNYEEILIMLSPIAKKRIAIQERKEELMKEMEELELQWKQLAKE